MDIHHAIRCDNEELVDLKSIFDGLSQNETYVNSLYEYFFISKGIKTIPANAFGKIRFRSVNIGGSVERIHYKAFQSTADAIVGYNTFYDQVYMRNEPYPYSQYDLVKSFKNLARLQLSKIKNGLLPDRAFGELPKLWNIRLRLESIEGSPFYELGNLTHISLSFGRDLKPKFIPASTFQFRKRGPNLMIIDLESNQLNSSSFETGVFQI